MSGDPIVYFDRRDQIEKQEAVYGETSLRFAYGTAPGRFLSWILFSRPFFSRLFGWYMKRPRSAAKILPFIEKYELDREEFSRPVEGFHSFNDFFIRELKEGSRPIDPDAAAVVFPADARHMGWQVLGEEASVFVKGQSWDLESLLGGSVDLVRRFSGGSLVLSRLCPVDYHHFHYPVEGQIRGFRWLGSSLFSVSPIALRRRLGYIWENKRCLTLIDTHSTGLVCFIEVGATNVGSIHHRDSAPGEMVAKGAAKGWFEFGGSSVITLFEPGRVQLCEDLVSLTAKGTELYARMGERMGEVSSQ